MSKASRQRHGNGMGKGFSRGRLGSSATVCGSAVKRSRCQGWAKGRPGNADILKAAGWFLRRCRCASAWLAFIVLVSGAALPASAGQQTQPAPLGEAVTLLGANSANDALSRPAQSGPLAVDLYFLVVKAPKESQGRLGVTEFVSQNPPANVVDAAIRTAGSRDAAAAEKTLPVSLAAPGMLHVRLAGGTLRPGTTYKGTLFLIAGEESNKWEVTLTTGAQGIIAAVPVGAISFDTFPPFNWFSLQGSAPLDCGTCSDACMGNFPITLRDKSGGGPYHRVRVFFDPTMPSKAGGSNFSLDTFSFWERTGATPARIDLELYTADVRGKEGTAPPPRDIDLDYQGQRTFIAAVKPLAPGEYTGTLRFGADESQDDAPEAKLALTILVRHHWVLPVLVILLGSLVGWYSSKYLVGVRKARGVARQIRAFRARADALSRHARSGSDWEFPGEGTSYGMALVRVMLSQLTLLSSSALPILVREEEIQQQCRDAELRIAALGSLRDVRLRVQPVAGGRPAAQKTIGRLLRQASDMIEQPAFGQAQHDELVGLLHSAEAWLAAETANKKYRESLSERLLSREVPDLSSVRTLPEGDLVRQQLEALLQACPTAAVLADSGADPAKFEEYDQAIAKLVLLWRDRKTGWAKKLAAGCAAGESLTDLYQTADGNVWETLRNVAKEGRLTLECASVCQGTLQAYDVVEIGCKLNIPEVPDMGKRIVYHPLRIGWEIVSPGGSVRNMETRGLTLAQYFPQPGRSRIKAVLRWQGEEIPLKNDLEIDVAENPEYSARRLLGGGFSEWATIVIAAGFAIVTAMGSQYDHTFGSFGQYVALFLWAAGAGTGGNIFKQLGPASAPGGQADVSLPSKPAGG